jgi:hypothetical protein
VLWNLGSCSNRHYGASDHDDYEHERRSLAKRSLHLTPTFFVRDRRDDSRLLVSVRPEYIRKLMHLHE